MRVEPQGVDPRHAGQASTSAQGRFLERLRGLRRRGKVVSGQSFLLYDRTRIAELLVIESVSEIIVNRPCRVHFLKLDPALPRRAIGNNFLAPGEHALAVERGGRIRANAGKDRVAGIKAAELL